MWERTDNDNEERMSWFEPRRMSRYDPEEKKKNRVRLKDAPNIGSPREAKEKQ